VIRQHHYQDRPAEPVSDAICQVHTQSEEGDTTSKPLSFFEMLQSTLWAALGVQKSENRKRDFARGKAHHFVLMGIGFAAFFGCSMAGIVQLVL
jgi:hypothetical protein